MATTLDTDVAALFTQLRLNPKSYRDKNDGWLKRQVKRVFRKTPIEYDGEPVRQQIEQILRNDGYGIVDDHIFVKPMDDENPNGSQHVLTTRNRFSGEEGFYEHFVVEKKDLEKFIEGYNTHFYLTRGHTKNWLASGLASIITGTASFGATILTLGENEQMFDFAKYTLENETPPGLVLAAIAYVWGLVSLYRATKDNSNFSNIDEEIKQRMRSNEQLRKYVQEHTQPLRKRLVRDKDKELEEYTIHGKMGSFVKNYVRNDAYASGIIKGKSRLRRSGVSIRDNYGVRIKWIGINEQRPYVGVPNALVAVLATTK